MDWEKQSTGGKKVIRNPDFEGRGKDPDFGKEGCRGTPFPLPFPHLDQLRPRPSESSRLAKIWMGSWPTWNSKKNHLDTQISLQPNESLESQSQTYPIGTSVEFLTQTRSWWLWGISRSPISRPVTELHWWEPSFGAGEICFSDWRESWGKWPSISQHSLLCHTLVNSGIRAGGTDLAGSLIC